MSDWKIIVPEAATNLIINPSFEIDVTTGWNIAGAGATRAVSTVVAFKGYRSCVLTSGGGATAIFYTSNIASVLNEVMSTKIKVYRPANTAVSVDVYDVTNGVARATFSAFALTGAWESGEISWTNNIGSINVVLRITSAIGATIYIDACQFQKTAYSTTYIDGDQPGGTWSGLRHASTSSRAANYRLGGREYDIQTQYGLRVRQFMGAGAPDYELMTQDLALQPGSVYLREKINQRALTLILDTNQTTLALLHSRRKAFWNVIKPDALGDSQPFLIGYAGGASGKTVYCAVRYAGGWGIDSGINGGRNFIEAGGEVALRLLAVDPFWYADDSESATLDFQDSIAASPYALARIGGAWQSLGTGFNGLVSAIAEDKERGRVYYGGVFTTANGVTVNGVCYWNGTTFVAMGGTPGIAGGLGQVLDIAIAPNGDVWVGGSFTSAGGATADGLARWNFSASTWTGFSNGTAGDVTRAIAIDKNGLVYFGGDFLNWDGDADQDYITSYNGSAFVQLSTGTNGTVYALKIGLDGTTLYVGGAFTSPQTRIMTWNGSAFAAMASGANATINAIAIDEAGNVYAGGEITTSYIARWNGSSWFTLGAGVNNFVYGINPIGHGRLLVAGQFTRAGDLAITDGLAIWNGSTWIQTDVSLSGTVVRRALEMYGNIYIGYITNPTALLSGRTTVTVASTADSYPVITITGPTTAATSSLLRWLENQTTGDTLYFNLTINAGEIITIDLRPQSRKVTSNWRGQLSDQPLPTSDFSSWRLVTGANVIAAFMTGTITGATMTMNWQKIHSSADGEAA